MSKRLTWLEAIKVLKVRGKGKLTTREKQAIKRLQEAKRIYSELERAAKKYMTSRNLSTLTDPAEQRDVVVDSLCAIVGVTPKNVSVDTIRDAIATEFGTLSMEIDHRKKVLSKNWKKYYYKNIVLKPLK